jgi:spermidine/putrescine-binding protein
MFGYLDMLCNYEDRKVDRFEDENLIVDTAEVTDSDQKYETAVQHPQYNEGEWIIVECYDTKEQAQEGHDKWVKKMTKEELPHQLKDVSTAYVTELQDGYGTGWRIYKRNR